MNNLLVFHENKDYDQYDDEAEEDKHNHYDMRNCAANTKHGSEAINWTLFYHYWI